MSLKNHLERALQLKNEETETQSKEFFMIFKTNSTGHRRATETDQVTRSQKI